MAPAPFLRQRPSPPAWPGVLLVLLPLLLGGCSGTRFGEALSRSFPNPTATPGASTTSTPASSQGGAPANPSAPSAGQAGTAGAPTPPAAAPTAGLVATPAGAGAVSTTTPVPKPAASSTPGTVPAVPAAGARPAVAQSTAARPLANPAPYRVTIRLPQADPSAPAEVVTEALRAAGVPFEVETIERMGAATTAAPASPAVAPVAPAVPQVRPAPPPR